MLVGLDPWLGLFGNSRWMIFADYGKNISSGLIYIVGIRLYLNSIGKMVTLEELGVRRAFSLLVGEGSSQIRDDPKGSGLACICK